MNVNLVNKLLITAGGRFDYNSRYGNTVNPRIGFVWKPIEKLKIKIRRKPVGFNLLPEKFTLPQIQILYESIYQREIDSRNFRKKLLSFDILTRTEEKDKSTSKKGAYLYKFNKDKFDEFVAKGYNFEL